MDVQTGNEAFIGWAGPSDPILGSLLTKEIFAGFCQNSALRSTLIAQEGLMPEQAADGFPESGRLRTEPWSVFLANRKSRSGSRPFGNYFSRKKR